MINLLIIILIRGIPNFSLEALQRIWYDFAYITYKYHTQIYKGDLRTCAIFTQGGTHIFGWTGMCRPNGSLFYKKSLNMGPVFLPKKSLNMGQLFWPEPQITRHTPVQLKSEYPPGIFILAWGFNWGSSVCSRNQTAYVTCIFCSLSVKINICVKCCTGREDHGRICFAFVFLVWSAKTRRPPIWAPWLTMPFHRVVYEVWYYTSRV